MSERTLYLLRHAKSSWDDPTLSDFDRTLTRRGEREAQWAAALMAERAIRPAPVLCSPSRRTRDTLAPLLECLPTADISFEPGIYEASASDLLALLRKQPATATRILMIGHNPGFEDFARALSGAGDASALKHLHRKYPPAGLAAIGFDLASWSDVEIGAGRLLSFDTPAD